MNVLQYPLRQLIMVDAYSFILGTLSTLSLLTLKRIIPRIYPYFLAPKKTLIADQLLKTKYNIISNNFKTNKQSNITFSSKDDSSSDSCKDQRQYIIISGATDGIGLAYLQQLIKLNYKIIAIGRNIKKLTDLREKYPEKDILHTIQYDYSKVNPSVCLQSLILNQFKGDDGQLNQFKRARIKGIINCAAISHFCRYQQLSMAEVQNINQVNLSSVNLTLKLIQSLQISQKQTQNQRQISRQIKGQNKSSISSIQPLFYINVSSSVAHRPQKYSSVYSATKAYQNALINTISQQEKAGISCKQRKIVYLDVMPWYVRTKMVGYQKSWDVVQPKDVVQGSFRVLGRRNQCCGTLKHEFLSLFYLFWQKSLKERIQAQMQKLIRMKQLRKKIIDKNKSENRDNKI